MVARRVYPEKSPPRVEYTLTAKGLELKAILGELGEWAIRWSARTSGPSDAVGLTVTTIDPHVRND